MSAAILQDDAVDAIAGAAAATLREARSSVREQLQAVHEAIFAPAHGDYGLTPADRSVIALFVAALHRDSAAIGYYDARLNALGVAGEVEEAVLTLADQSGGSGPFGGYPPGTILAAESTTGPHLRLPLSTVFGVRIARGLEYAHLVLLHPRDTTEEDLDRLREAGWTADQIVILTQIVAALSFQLRVAVGARAIARVAASAESVAATRAREGARRVDSPDAGDSGEHPRAFTDRIVAWKPWITDDRSAAPSEVDWVGLFGKRRASSPSFRLSARDPYISLPLSRLEDDIFADGASGLDRAERELGALVVSRENGCLYCASVHSRATEKFSGRGNDVRAILDDGPRVDLGSRWNVFADAALAVTSTPLAWPDELVAALVAQSGDATAALDFVHSVGYFNFANRIMLALGEPVLA
ncbi:CMD domain protein [Microbacterium sp.]|uniref:CMD domain protein n=1 Tax=Microbacterium sp. TaxID=51671 RepID=UPI0039E3206D